MECDQRHRRRRSRHRQRRVIFRQRRYDIGKLLCLIGKGTECCGKAGWEVYRCRKRPDASPSRYFVAVYPLPSRDHGECDWTISSRLGAVQESSKGFTRSLHFSQCENLIFL